MWPMDLLSCFLVNMPTFDWIWGNPNFFLSFCNDMELELLYIFFEFKKNLCLFTCAGIKFFSVLA